MLGWTSDLYTKVRYFYVGLYCTPTSTCGISKPMVGFSNQQPTSMIPLGQLKRLRKKPVRLENINKPQGIASGLQIPKSNGVYNSTISRVTHDDFKNNSKLVDKIDQLRQFKQKRKNGKMEK